MAPKKRYQFFWVCSSCGTEDISIQSPLCPSCGHMRCPDCTVERIRTRSHGGSPPPRSRRPRARRLSRLKRSTETSKYLRVKPPLPISPLKDSRRLCQTPIHCLCVWSRYSVTSMEPLAAG
ncbi:hypothetical protein GQ53DRAFT_417917 [Thozetella sp. PMI_491]|nr:hypothetical protein GQ53DRAFT_417917 [Thozetella sp. PMI_491]